jgi:hypothetical protein
MKQITLAKIMKNRVPREASATLALALRVSRVDASFGGKFDPESSPGVVLFRPTVGVTDEGATVADGVGTGFMGEAVCFQTGYTIL